MRVRVRTRFKKIKYIKKKVKLILQIKKLKYNRKIVIY